MIFARRKLLSLLLVTLISSVFFFGCSQKEINSNHDAEQSEFSGGDIKKIVDTNLETIISSPKLSSNPNDYIQEHKAEYQEIVDLGQPAFDYMVEKLENASAGGLDTWIMASLCSDILGDKNPVKDWASGKEWLEKYSQNK